MLINNAGVNLDAPGSYGPENVRRTLDVNFRGTVEVGLICSSSCFRMSLLTTWSLDLMTDLLWCCRCVIDYSHLLITHHTAAESSTSHPLPLQSAPTPRPSSPESATPLPAKTSKKSPNYSKYAIPDPPPLLIHLLTLSLPVHNPLWQRIRNRLRPTRPLLQREQSPPPLRHQPPRRRKPKSPHQFLLSRLGINRHGQIGRRETS